MSDLRLTFSIYRYGCVFCGLFLLMPLSALSQAPPPNGTYYELVINEYTSDDLSVNLEVVQNGQGTAIWNLGAADGLVPGGNDDWTLQLNPTLPTDGAFANGGVNPITGENFDPVFGPSFTGGELPGILSDNHEWLTQDPGGTANYNYINWSIASGQIHIQSDVDTGELSSYVQSPAFQGNFVYTNNATDLIGGTARSGPAVYLNFNDLPPQFPDNLPDQGVTALLLALSLMGLFGTARWFGVQLRTNS